MLVFQISYHWALAAKLWLLLVKIS